MTPLFQKAIAYLVRGGYHVIRSTPGFAEAEFAGDDPGDRDVRILIWVEDVARAASHTLSVADRAARAAHEDGLLTSIISEMQADHEAVGYFLVPTRQGLSREFSSAATAALQRGRRDDRGGIRSEAQFFDTAYKLDTAAGNRVRASVFATLVSRARHRRRVAQPFFVRRGLAPTDRKSVDGDLVEHLETLFRDPVSRATLRIVDGPAGGGKSVAFEALAASLFEEFIAAKREQIVRGRPIVFLPEHIRGETIGYVDDVIDAMTSTEAADPVEPEQLRFLLTHGHAVWMFDGLDEFFAGDNDFFTFLANELANPDSRAQMLICSRDSLMSSSSALRTFVESQLARGHGLEIYELAPWNAAAWAKLAWLELEHGRTGAEASEKVVAFTAALAASPELSSLASLPFYCTVLLDHFRTTGAMPPGPLDALDTIIERMMTREGDKGVFRWRDFVDPDELVEVAVAEAPAIGVMLANGQNSIDAIGQVLDGEGRDSVLEMLGALAHQHCRGGKAARENLDVADIAEVMGASVASDAAPEQRRVATALVQFAFFGAGRRAGAVDFTHPILAEYLAGLYAADLLRRAVPALAPGTNSLSRTAVLRGAVRNAIGVAELKAQSIFLRILQREMSRDPAIGQVLAGASAVMGKEPAAVQLALATLVRGVP